MGYLRIVIIFAKMFDNQLSEEISEVWTTCTFVVYIIFIVFNLIKLQVLLLEEAVHFFKEVTPVQM